jgi:hypothetical protein
MTPRQCVWVIGVTAVLFLLCASGVRAEDKVLSGLTEEELGKAFDRLSDKWYPVAIKGYARGKQSRYDVTWRKGDPGWYLYYGMSAAKYAERKAQLRKKGMRVEVESSWTVDGESLYAAIWRKKSD